MVIKWNSVEDADGTVPLGVGFAIVTVEVTAQDGTTTQTYIVFVKRPGVTVSPTELTVGEGGSSNVHREAGHVAHRRRDGRYQPG